MHPKGKLYLMVSKVEQEELKSTCSVSLPSVKLPLYKILIAYPAHLILKHVNPLEFKTMVKWQLKEIHNRGTRVRTKNIKKKRERGGEGGRDGGRKAEQMEGGDTGKGWKLKIECEIWKGGIQVDTEGCKGWRAKGGRVSLPGKFANACSFGWELEGCSLSDINTEHL